MASERILFVPVGNNPARLFGMDARTRACRLAENMGLECAERADRAAVLASMAYAWDPAWLRDRTIPFLCLVVGNVLAALVLSRNALDVT